MKKKIPSPFITISATRFKKNWKIGGDFSKSSYIEWTFDYDTVAFEKFEKELSKLLKKYEVSPEEQHKEAEFWRKEKLRKVSN